MSRFLVAAVTAVFVSTFAAPPQASAQIRINFGKDGKPRLEMGSNQGGNQNNQGGNHNHQQPGNQRNWVVNPQAQRQIDYLPQIIGSNAKYVIRDPGHGDHRGSYYCKGDHYYYVPQTGHLHEPPRPVELRFGGFSHVDELAQQLEMLMNEICLDLHYNYGHNYHFQETYGEAYQVYQAAKFVHAAEHQNNRQAIRDTLGGVDALFHHVEDDVRGWSRHHRRQIGQGGIVTKLEAAEATLHHLMNDVGVHPTGTGEVAPPPAGYTEQAPPPGSPPVGAPTLKVNR